MTEAPIPMETSEAIVVAELLRGSLPTREARAIEVLIRHARRNRTASAQTVDLLSDLIEARAHVDRALSLLTEAIGRSPTSQGVP